MTDGCWTNWRLRCYQLHEILNHKGAGFCLSNTSMYKYWTWNISEQRMLVETVESGAMFGKFTVNVWSLNAIAAIRFTRTLRSVGEERCSNISSHKTSNSTMYTTDPCTSQNHVHHRPVYTTEPCTHPTQNSVYYRAMYTTEHSPHFLCVPCLRC